MDIVYEDNHLLVVNKPVGWIVQGAQADQDSLLERAKSYIKQKYNKPGSVYLGVVSRLDGPVSGLVPLARTSKAAARLSEQIRDRSVKKIYWAVTSGTPPRPCDRIEHWLARHESETVTRVVARATSQSQQAILEYRTLGASGENSSLSTAQQQSWLEIELVTGRKHQIRAQLEAIGCPILGDEKYGSHVRFSNGIALHCRRLVFQHPTKKETLDLTAAIPSSWPPWIHES
ncbi:MAG: RluA family pseudouridine synthase [Pirellula sp.]|jgi:23S rRNA pseudouridine1911/1915/1917 synthase|nr:RluA family pseudouridine synthase [Pirellula sp.]